MPDINEKQYSVTKDSGKKQEFETGAHRDTQEGKGRYDLIPPAALRRVAGVYERGAVKYGQRNWERGMPIGRFLDSALRHVYQYIEGRRDEDHLAQALWNIAGAIHVETMVDRGVLPKALDDMPNHLAPTKTETSEKPLCGPNCCCTAASSRSLSEYAGKLVVVSGRVGRIVQLADLTPPDKGIAADIVMSFGPREAVRERWGWCFKDRHDLDRAVRLADGGER